METPLPGVGDLERPLPTAPPPSPISASISIGSFRLETSFLNQTLLEKPRLAPQPKPVPLPPKIRQELRWQLMFTNGRERNLLRDCVSSEWKELYKVDLLIATK